MNDFMVTIPIHTHLKKFMSKSCEVSPHFRINLNKDHYSDLFYALLSKPCFKQGSKSSYKKVYTDNLAICIPETLARENRFTISHPHVIRINEFIRKEFYRSLFTHLDLLSPESGQIQKYIFSFMNYYTITEEDITFEALKKAYYRHRTSKSA